MLYLVNVLSLRRDWIWVPACSAIRVDVMVRPFLCWHRFEACNTFERKFSKISIWRSNILNPSQTMRSLIVMGKLKTRSRTNAMSRGSPSKTVLSRDGLLMTFTAKYESLLSIGSSGPMSRNRFCWRVVLAIT